MGTKRSNAKNPLPLVVCLVSTLSIAAVAIDAKRQEVSAQSAPKLEDTVVFAMSGVSAQEVMQKCAAEDFTKKSGVRVEFLSIQSQPALARILAQRNNPTIDVMWSIPQTEHTGFKEGVFVPVSTALIPNLANLDPKYPLEPNSGALVATAMQGIQYNTKVFKENGWNPPTSWRDLWDPKYRGRVAITGLGIGTGIGMVGVAGMLNGGDPKNFDAAFDYLAKLKPNLYTIFQQAPQYEAAMLDGSIWLGIVSNGRPLAMMQQGAPVSFVQPVEGIITANVYVSIVKGAPHPNAAAAFVDWMLSNEAQSCLLRAGYAPVVKGVEVPADLVPFLKVQRQTVPIDWVYFQDNLPELLKRWRKDLDG